ncbi:hypothetical protein JB92DRAFT_2827946 [Gautieria morchelliformis]|nr:hypothetical protein JB92DRAFT_2827946 [Gautieria morchelliformis]
MFVSRAEDTVGAEEEELSAQQKLLVAASEGKDRLERSVCIAEGMRAMLTWNLVVSADLANGTQGTVEKIFLDPRESQSHRESTDNIVQLEYPPALILFCPDSTPIKNLRELSPGLIPLEPSKKGMRITYSNGRKGTIHRRQLSLTAAYAFTDYKAQGQTLQPVIIDIGNPPSGGLNAFNAYVAISRGRSRNTIRFLREFNSTIFTHHPDLELAECDKRLRHLNDETTKRYEMGRW